MFLQLPNFSMFLPEPEVGSFVCLVCGIYYLCYQSVIIIRIVIIIIVTIVSFSVSVEVLLFVIVFCCH